MISEITLQWECCCEWCGVGLFPDEGAAEAEDGSVYCSYECAIAADQVLCVSPEEGE